MKRQTEPEISSPNPSTEVEDTRSTMQRIVDEYSVGGSDVEVARILKINLADFYELCQDNLKFKQVVERGRTLAQAWWYEQGRKGLFDKNMNSSMYIFNMKNRYGWADKIDTGEKNNQDPVNIDQAKADLETAMRRLAKSNPEMLRNLKVVNSE